MDVKKIVFGPVRSRRFGLSLGVDLSPMMKQCNFDCLYCELQKSPSVDTMTHIVPHEEILQEIKKACSKGIDYDVLTFSANGEPTLYPDLLPLLQGVKSFLKQLSFAPKILILSNGSLFGDVSVQKALLECDIVKFSLDAASEAVFRKIDRSIKHIHIDSIIEGIKDFKRQFNGDLIAEVLLVKGVNDQKSEVQKIAQALKDIHPKRVDLGSIDRPPAYPVKPLSDEELMEFLPLFEGLNVLIPRRKAQVRKMRSYSEQEILETLKRRPLNDDDLSDMFDETSLKLLKDLKHRGLIWVECVANVSFYRA